MKIYQQLKIKDNYLFYFVVYLDYFYILYKLKKIKDINLIIWLIDWVVICEVLFKLYKLNCIYQMMV